MIIKFYHERRTSGSFESEVLLSFSGLCYFTAPLFYVRPRSSKNQNAEQQEPGMHTSREAWIFSSALPDAERRLFYEMHDASYISRSF